MAGPMAAEASVNAMYAKKIADIGDPGRARGFHPTRDSTEQRADINLLRLASELVVDTVVEPGELRVELVGGWPMRRAGPARRASDTGSTVPCSRLIESEELPMTDSLQPRSRAADDAD